MKFFTIKGDSLEERIWCDNDDCPYFGTRRGIPDYQKIVTVDRHHFCTKSCYDQAASTGLVPSQEHIEKATQLLKEGKTLFEAVNDLKTQGMGMALAVKVVRSAKTQMA